MKRSAILVALALLVSFPLLGQTESIAVGNDLERTVATSDPNTQLVATSPSRTFARQLVKIDITCSGALGSDITATAKILRTSTQSDPDLASIPISAGNDNGGLVCAGCWLLSGDQVEVTVPAAGAGIPCDVTIVEVTR